jgi:predicted dehydrogenase
MLYVLCAVELVDVVYIGTINTTHVPLSRMMLEAGKNVLCEKPMALSTARVNEVLDLARQKQKLFAEVNVIQCVVGIARRGDRGGPT